MIRWPPPADVYVDTGVLIAAMFPGTPDAQAAAQFCGDLVDNGARVYVSQTIRLDLARALRQLATKPNRLPEDLRQEFDLSRWASNPLIRSRWLWHGVREFDRLTAQFATFAEIPFTMSVWRESIDLMAAETLDSSDAMHLAAARSVGISHLATTDADFRRITSPRVIPICDQPTA